MTRRRLLRDSAGWAIFGSLGDGFGAARLAVSHAAPPQPLPEMVRLEPDLEPLVRKIETTPREQCFAMITAELRAGLSYRKFLAALFLAGVRNVNPHPPGFDLHCVFVIQAAHQLALDAAAHERWLPLYWALDEFKNAQASDAQKNGDYRMTPLADALPNPARAWRAFHGAMEDWDRAGAEAAVAALVRAASPGEIVESLWRYGARDFRNIGHKAIFVANAVRTLDVIGWRHAEPVLRSLVAGLVDFGPDERVNEYAYDDQAYGSNLRRTKDAEKKLPASWAGGAAEESATRQMLDLLREGDVDKACQATLDGLLQGRLNAQAVWDAVHLAAGEQMLRQPGIVALHSVTSISALRHAFRATTVAQTRLLMLLQAVGWTGQFQKAGLARREKRNDAWITKLDTIDLPANQQAALQQVFGKQVANPAEAAAAAYAYGKQGLDAAQFASAARSLVFFKATDPHGYKYPAAVFEDYHGVSPRWRPQMLAISTYYLPLGSAPDTQLMIRAREAIASLDT